MKVALMHNFFYSNSGATEVVFNTAIQLKKWDHNVYVFVLNGKDDVLRRFDEEGIHAESASFTEWRTNNTRFLSIIDSIMLFVNKIRAFLLFMSLAGRINRDYDVAFTSHYHLTPLMHIFLKIQTVYYCHEPPRQYYEPLYGGGEAFRSFSWKLTHILDYLYGIFDKRLDRFCVRKASKVLANSIYTKGLVKAAYRVEAEVIYPGANLESCKNLNLEREFILSVGRFYLDLKGHHFVIKSLGLIEGEKPPLIVVGDGTVDEKKRLFGLARECGVFLEIKSEVGREELVGLYNKAKVCVFGYVREPFGLTAVEAMACETPIVAVAEGGLTESITEDAGFLVERDEKKFAEKMEFILKNPDRGRIMGAAGRRRVEERFTWDRFGEDLERVLVGVVKANKTS